MSRIRSQISYYDLTGGLNNVSTPDTLNSSPKKTESPDMVNVEFLKLGGIKSMEGNIPIGDQQTAEVVGGWEYTKGNNKYMMIALKTGEVKRYDESTSTFETVYTFPSNSPRVSFCNMNNGVVFTNGIDEPMFYEIGRRQLLTGVVATTANSNAVTGTGTQFDTELHAGDTVEIDEVIYTVDSVTDATNLTLVEEAESTLTNENIYISEISSCNATLINTDPEVLDHVDKPIRGNAIQFYAGRLWVGGKDGLFYSQLGQYNKWDEYYDAGMVDAIYNDTSEVRALGLYADYMLVHKEFNTYLLTLTGVANGVNSTLSIKPYSNVSCDSQQSWIVSNTKYYVYSRENMDIYPLSQRTVFSDKYLGDAITNKVRNVFQNLRDADAENIFCATLPRKRWMLFYMPMVDRLGSSYALIFDFQTKSFVVRKVPQTVTIAFNFNNEVYIGTEDGLVLKEFTGSSFNGEPIISYYKSPWFDWAGDYFHSFSEFAIDMASEYRNKFYLRTFKDGDSPYEDRIIDDNSLVTSGLIWDGGIEEPQYSYILQSFPITVEGITTYRLTVKIPDIDPNASADTVITENENVFFTNKKNGDDLEIYKMDPATFELTLITTISDYFADGLSTYMDGHIETNYTTWDNDVWVSGSFNSIRMLLPNNVFETFQLEIGTNELGQAFAVYGYNFRRIETEEAPW